MPAIVIVYLVLSLIVAILGRKTFIGFWGIFIFSLFFSPIPSLIYILATRICNRFFAKETV